MLGKHEESIKCCEKGCTLLSRLKKQGDDYKIIYGDEKTDFIVNYAEDPEVDGHLVIQPRGHIEQIANLKEEQAKELMQLIWKCCTALQNVYSPKKIYVHSFNEAKGYHLHIHIKPKAQTIPDELRGPCFVNYEEPCLKELRKAVEEERDCGKRRELKEMLDRRNKNEIVKIKKFFN